MKTLRVSYNGNRYLLHAQDNDTSTSRALLDAGAYETSIVKLIATAVEPDFVCFDVGANIGILSIAPAHYASAGQVFALEPFASSYECLMATIAANSLRNISAENIALGASDGRGIIHTTDGNYGAATLITRYAGAAEENETIIRSLDSWAKERKIGRLDFVKVDIEGSEFDFVRGGIDTLKRYRPQVIMEWNLFTLGENSKPLYSLLREIYAKIYVISRLEARLMRIGDLAELMGIGSFGHRIADIYCYHELPRGVEALLAPLTVISSAIGCTMLYKDGIQISMLNFFADGWLGNDKGTIIINMAAGGKLEMVIDTLIDTNLTIIAGDNVNHISLTKSIPQRLKFPLEPWFKHDLFR